jgi:polysaccharide export outer membrane protein
MGAQAAAAAPSNDRSYKLGPGDEIRVTVFNEPDLKVEQKIAAQGEINMPLIGDVSANGLTSADLARSIEARLSKGYLREPRVSVTVITYRPFYVIGEVSRPGSYAFTPNLTVASAIATAGGFAKGANKGAVYVRRLGETEERKIKVSESMQLGPGDTIRVGRSALSTLSDIPFGLLGVLP